jgi:hypothetical protein
MPLFALAFAGRFCYFPTRSFPFPGCTRMNRYATAGSVLLLVTTVGLQAQAQDKTHSAKKPSIERRLQILED